ncbi:maleylpyruvate isomerase family mycothiol-dependent enzyme [Mycobacterium sp. ITM-2016-00318]|uniref:maleylpyruvate isomerase family mycothiol-dependent enzyme n=1 Tax=Mycobacterium sp. ITM-2016-00318 TaxID=2099693 RepID=UPI000CF8F0DF|nr:maleylpyruvate isomerase family mycothiol-dependent enzyme [Mycobacterium sp. ITM-2016-00318]WNG93252.1 maleylpyruvate isomerase family mycothiol-dependent enzyme [Mycobacterium sp. ITM-2016-00318]
MDMRAALIEETAALGELIRDADPATPVPTCPDWTLRQLFRHVGRGNRWAAQIVADRRDTPLDPREVRDGKPPDDPDAAVDWLNAGAQLILDSVDDVGADTYVWTFIGPRPAQWWIRRRVHEATVHRADAAISLGTDFELAPDVAADAIDEWFERIAVEAGAESSPLDAGRTLHLHATDDGLGGAGEWTLTGTGEGIVWSHEHGKGDAALRGRAKDLLLAVVRRQTAADGGLEVFGDTAVWDGWLNRTPF